MRGVGNCSPLGVDMPLYQYECECGKTFEALKSIESRHDVTCECGGVPKLKMSSSMFRVAEPFTVIGHDGTILSSRQTTEKTKPAKDVARDMARQGLL